MRAADPVESAINPDQAFGTRLEEASSLEDLKPLLVELINKHEGVTGEEARQLRHLFLTTVEDCPELLGEDSCSTFLAEHFEAADFHDYDWSSPVAAVALYENLFGLRFRDEQVTENLTRHAQTLLKQALHHYQQAGEEEKVFDLLRHAPTPLTRNDPELWRLRHQAHLYERDKVTRRRRLLYGYLMAQAVLILFVFPFLFINAENGKLQDQIENMTAVELPEEQRRSFNYTDGLYWSIITAASIGYGDITPQTGVGKVIAAVLGVSGVITVGVIAGLILSWVTPRRLSED